MRVTLHHLPVVLCGIWGSICRAALATRFQALRAHDTSTKRFLLLRAREVLRAAMPGFQTTLGQRHDQTLFARRTFALVTLHMGDVSPAEALLRGIRADADLAMLSPAHPIVIQVRALSARTFKVGG
jgi:hypothetical protein